MLTAASPTPTVEIVYEHLETLDSMSTPTHGIRLVGQRAVGGYEILAALGKGGAGEVFLALTAGPGGFQKLVVIKSLHAHFEEDPEVVEMFLDEARLAARLNHPNIVQTLEVGVEGDRHFIAMAYLEGIPLDRVMRRLEGRDQPVDPHVAARIVAEVCSGLHYAHDLEDYDGSPLGIVHRDVSPANILLSWDGSVRLLDFGIAKAATRRANTDSGVIKGKFGYISPEQAIGGEVDRRADIWSAGVCLWEMLAARHLFPRVNDIVTLQTLAVGPIPSLAEHAPEVPESLVAIVERALTRDPEERFSDAGQMQQALETWLDSAARNTTRDDVAAMLGDYFGGEREQQEAMLRASVGGQLTLTPTGSFSVPPRTGESVVEDESSHRGPSPWPLAIVAVLVCAVIVLLTAIGTGGGEVRNANRPTPEAIPSEAAPTLVSDDELQPSVEAPTPEVPIEAGEATDEPEMRSASEAIAGAMNSLRTPRPVREAEPLTVSEPVVEEAPEPPPVGRLTFDTVPWTEVWIDGQHVGDTPLIRHALPAGEVTLHLRNREEHIDTRYRVQVRSGQTTTRRLGLH